MATEGEENVEKW